MPPVWPKNKSLSPSSAFIPFPPQIACWGLLCQTLFSSSASTCCPVKRESGCQPNMNCLVFFRHVSKAPGCMCTHSYPTLCSPADCSPPGSFGLEWVAISYSKGSFWLRIEPASLLFPALAGGFFTTAPPGKPLPSFLVHLINIMVPGSQINLILLMSWVTQTWKLIQGLYKTCGQEKEMATHCSILPGKVHGQKSLVDCSPWGYMTEHGWMRVEGDGLVINW